MGHEIRLSGYILAGGKSSRFGSDKARAVLCGQALIVRIAAALAHFCSDIFVVADQAAKYADLGLLTLADQHPGCGPISGLETALRHVGDNRWILAISCDWAILPTGFLQLLLSAPREKCQAVAYYDDRWQPLPALYHTSILPKVEWQIQTGEFALWKLLQSTSATRVNLPGELCRGVHINTPAELLRIMDL